MSGWLVPFLAGAATGILSGFGVGGGTLLLIYMTAFAGLPQEQAQGINLLYFLPAAAASLPAHAKNGFLEKPVLLPAIAAGLACAALGAWTATGMDTSFSSLWAPGSCLPPGRGAINSARCGYPRYTPP